MTEKKLDRRGFILGGAALVAGAASARCLPDVAGQWKDEGQALCTGGEVKVTPGDPAQAGRVVELHDPALQDPLDPQRLVPSVVAEDLKKLLLSLTGQPDPRSAWTALLPALAPGQIVGLKVNTLNPQVPTHPELIRALVDSLKDGLGLPAEQILVWDRRLDELTRAGLTATALGATVEGTWETAKDKGAGRGYEVSSICIGGRKTHLSNILTRRVDHLINVAVVKRHDASGFTGCLKNHYGSIDNPGDFHDKLGEGGGVLDARFERAIPELNALSEVTGKTRLWLLDSTLIVSKGGTESPVDTISNRLLCGLDPVALDLRGRQIRDEERGALGPDPEKISEGWLRAAERAGLGSGSVKLQPVG